MTIRFILGRSGTGKTSFCVKAIAEALLAPGSEQPLIFLVPEQATYQAERAILSDRRIAGYSRLNVLSFNRLQFMLLGKNTATPTLSHSGQQMIIHRILRDNKDKLKAFAASANLVGLSSQMAQTVAELGQYGKTQEDIEGLLDKLRENKNNLTVLKFGDIGLVFKEYLRFIEGRFIDPDVQLSQARKAAGEAGFIKGARLWVDGFAGFTTNELSMLAELMRTASDTQIALCLDGSKIDLANSDPGAIDPVSLFNPTERTYTELLEIIKKCKLRLAEPVILKKAVRFSGCEPIAHIERNLFTLDAPKQKAGDNIHVISAPNERMEVQFVARKIMRLVKENQLRYRDIAVIASDIERYQPYIAAYFEDYGIPFFIDKRKPLNQHPVVQLVCSALDAVIGRFSNSNVFSYLKSDLVPMARDDIDLLENYCTAFGIAGGDWQDGKDWQFDDEKEPKFNEVVVNEIRLRAARPLLELRDKLCPKENQSPMLTSSEFTKIVFDFLDGLKVVEKVGNWVEQAIEIKDYATVEEHRQFYDRFVSIFDELVEVFGGQQMRCEDYVAIINSAFSQMTLAFIPPGLDQVLVGSIERSRHPDLKAVFVTGATQKQFPVPISYRGILSDDDRIAAESAEFELAATMEQTLSQRQYLAYIAFTRPSRFLYVTYPSADESGHEQMRSQFIASLEGLFEDFKEESIAGEQVDIEKINSRMELADLLCRRLGRDAAGSGPENGQLEGLVRDMCSDEQLAEAGGVVQAAVDYKNRAKLDDGITGKLFGRQIKSSATKLGVFAACPYRYFAEYILELKERKEFKLEPLDLGIFYHGVLDCVLKELNNTKKDFATICNEELLAILWEQITRVISESAFISNFKRHSAHNSFIIKCAGEVLEDCVLAISQMVRAGQFWPSESEVWFGKAGEGIGDYKLAIENGRILSLSGKIDRIDVAQINGKQAALVFDYKSKGKFFDWSKFRHGLDMQLAIYLLAVRSSKKYGDIAGAFYMPVDGGMKKAFPDELDARKDSFNHKAKGIFNGEYFDRIDSNASGWSKYYNLFSSEKNGPYGHYSTSGALKPKDFEKVLRLAEENIIRIGEQIASGKIEITPYKLGDETACSVCKYQSVCRFDWQINDYNPLTGGGKGAVVEVRPEGNNG